VHSGRKATATVGDDKATKNAPTIIMKVPVQAPNIIITRIVTIQCPPKANITTLPLFRDVIGVSQIPFEHVCVHDSLVS
jgi:hypothetical protein